MKKLLLLLLPCIGFAQIPAYYNSIDFSQNGNALKSQLTTLITATHTTELVYTPGVWDALRQTDLDPNNPENVLLVYGYNDADAIVSNDRSRDKDLSCHTSSCSGLWVREHVFPRSLGNPNLEFEGPGSDAHHLRAIDNSMNNSRSNRPYEDGSGNASVLADGNFYPGDEWRGDVARMIMYMYVRYQTQCLPTVVGIGSTSYSTFGDMPNVFLEWNAEDPVSAYEMNRNNILQNLQGNRNPFIDDPYIATMIWNGPQAADTWGVLSTAIVASEPISVYPTITNGVVYVTHATGTYTYLVYNTLGQQVPFKASDDVIDLSGNAEGVYFLKAADSESVQTFKLILQ